MNETLMWGPPNIESVGPITSTLAKSSSCWELEKASFIFPEMTNPNLGPHSTQNYFFYI